MMARQEGAVLLLVSILLTLIAALTFALGRDRTAAIRSVNAQYDAAAARYLAEAALAQARWVNQSSGCGNDSVSSSAFASGKIKADVQKAGGKKIDIVATGWTGMTVDSAQASITRKNVVLHNLSKAPTSADLGGATIDTFIVAGTPTAAYGSAASLELNSNASNVLLYWPANDLPADVLVVSATLTLTQTATSSIVRPATLHRVLRAWDANATWRKSSPGTWTTQGGDYSAAIATANIASSTTVSWDVTALVAGWVSRSIPNNGMLLRLVSPGQSASFHSMQAGSSASRPTLRVTYAKPC